MFPHRFDFIVGERKAAGGRYWIRSQKFGEAPVYYIHFKGEPVKVAPQVLDGRLGAIEIVDGEIVQDEELHYNDWNWDCPCPEMGG